MRGTNGSELRPPDWQPSTPRLRASLSPPLCTVNLHGVPGSGIRLGSTTERYVCVEYCYISFKERCGVFHLLTARWQRSSAPTGNTKSRRLEDKFYNILDRHSCIPIRVHSSGWRVSLTEHTHTVSLCSLGYNCRYLIAVPSFSSSSAPVQSPPPARFFLFHLHSESLFGRHQSTRPLFISLSLYVCREEEEDEWVGFCWCIFGGFCVFTKILSPLVSSVPPHTHSVFAVWLHKSQILGTTFG